MIYGFDVDFGKDSLGLVDGIGIRLMFAGCYRGLMGKCPDCHNKHLWSFESGRYFVSDDKFWDTFREHCIAFNVSYVVLTGGEPLDQPIRDLVIVLGKVCSIVPNAVKILFTGYSEKEVLKQFWKEPIVSWVWHRLDYVKVGNYDRTQACEGGPLASKNQKVLSIQDLEVAVHEG